MAKTPKSCAPDAEHEDHLYNYVFALVERYDGDGVMDMGHTTPNDTNDDLIIPIQFYVFVGEVEFTGPFLNRVMETLPKTI